MKKGILLGFLMAISGALMHDLLPGKLDTTCMLMSICGTCVILCTPLYIEMKRAGRW